MNNVLYFLIFKERIFNGIWTLPDGSQRTIALKKVFVLEKEAEILSKIRHKNIIQFYGICKATGNDFFIVTEYAERGSLYDFIHSGESHSFSNSSGGGNSFDAVVKWASQIANGIHYLHYDAVDTIIHRDLKSKNVVLDKNLVCKICDFGTSKDLTHSCTAPSWGGTAAWMSPEMILQSEGLTTATDVWSYGVVLWEILSKEVPYRDYSEFRIFTMITQSGITLAIPPTCPAPLKQLMNNCWKMTPKDRANMRQIQGELNRLMGNQKVMDECEKFMGLEDWKTEIAKQEKNVEKMRKDLEKRREQLEIREKALKQRMKVEQAVLDSARHPPEDVHQWSEHHTSHWVETVLGRVANDKKFLDRVNAAVFRNRITGARLLEMTQNDLEHLGVHKVGSRIELMKSIRKLGDTQKALHAFPTLAQAKQIEMSLKTEKESPGHLANGVDIVIIVGMYVRKMNPTLRKFKFYADSDWIDETDIPPKSKSKHASALIKTVCFSVLDDNTKKPINEPACSISSGMTTNPDWITVDTEDDVKVKVIVSVYYADIVTQPRSTEIMELVTCLDESRILEERHIHLRLRRSSSSASISTPSPVIAPSYHPFGHVTNGFHHTTSSPQLRGFWHRKQTGMNRHGLTETELSSLQEHLRTPSPDKNTEENVVIEVPKIPRRRRTTTNNSEETDVKEPENRTRRVQVVGGKDKWNWKKGKSRPKFS
ncbi:CBN-ZAK-1 protein [Caenorhabditis brenneri]|uniref:CBN-ZAK-1 protein n=1 Tax=Caenorhabditis brenneri TaxID=135651 RepID=G0MEV6_CAEBE|nr:CBN-ZAK-1 protein [Caenorhabditis brenneri]